ncbi:MAG: CHAT domain-containing protein [Verrucomicrobiales bacterium]|nr:CHAT domain-containing protein [Verrucomicrobiales bacterium]
MKPSDDGPLDLAGELLGSVFSGDEFKPPPDQVASPIFTEKTNSGNLADTGRRNGNDLLSGFTVSRSHRMNLEVELIQGDISQADTEAIILARFQNMDLGRAALAVDELMGGALTRMVERRMFNSNVGEMFILPTGRHPIRAEFVAVAGLGNRNALIKEDGSLAWDLLELVAENSMRTLLAAGVSEFATLLFGNLAEAGPRLMKEGMRRFFIGFLRAMGEMGRNQRLRRILLCEADPERYSNLRVCLLELLQTPLFENIQVEVNETILPIPSVQEHRSMMAAAAGEEGRDPAYLIVTTGQVDSEIEFVMTFISPEGRSTVPQERIRISKLALENLLQAISPQMAQSGAITETLVERVGADLSGLLLHPNHLAILASLEDCPLIIVHDKEASRVPWEVLRDGGTNRPFACGGGISRQYAATNLSVAKWGESLRDDETLSVLLVINPTGDLDGAEQEGREIHNILATMPGINFGEVNGRQATKRTLLEHFRSGRYDVIHFAGHAFYDAASPENSGILCARDESGGDAVIRGTDLASMGRLPMLMFFNACESARIRNVENNLIKVAGAAEAIMRGGVANFVGTYWPVSDTAASVFASTFYTNICMGCPLGKAVTAARRSVLDARSGDWADYLHYGQPNFIIKENSKGKTGTSAASLS